MKTLLKRKFVAITIAIAVLSLVITGTVWAISSFAIPSQVKVVAATSDIKLYTDPALTDEVKSLVWADLPAGSGTRFRTIYIKNFGNSDVNVVATVQGLPSGVTLVGEAKTVVQRGGSGSLTITLMASKTAVLDASFSAFTLTVTSTVVDNTVPTTPTTTTTTTTTP